MKKNYSLTEIIAIITRKIAEIEGQAIKQSDFSDLTFRQIYYLETIDSLGNPTPTELARTLKVSKPTVSVAIDKLVELGLIHKVDSDEDKRSLHLHLTKKGKKLAHIHDQVHQKIVQLMTSELAPGKVEQLADLLNEALQSLEDES